MSTDIRNVSKVTLVLRIEARDLEIARLRAALEMIRDFTPAQGETADAMRNIARTTLEQAP